MRLAFRSWLATALLVAAAPAFAAGNLDTLDAGPPVGAKIPHDLSTVDQDGRHRDFKGLARERGLIVLFTRSVDW